MKQFVSLFLLVFSPASLSPLLAADQVIGQRRFRQQANHWIEQGLSDQQPIEPDHACVYKDAVWQKWFQNGNAEVREILDLGQSVIFWYPHAEDKQRTVYRVFRTREHLEEAREMGLLRAAGSDAVKGAGAAKGGAAGSSGGGAAAGAAGGGGVSVGTTALIVGGAAAVAGLAAAGGGGGSDTQTKR